MMTTSPFFFMPSVVKEMGLYELVSTVRASSLMRIEACGRWHA